MILDRSVQTVSQLQPFNQARLVDCMAYLSMKHRCAFTQYDVVKLHLMTDVRHVLSWGRPVIGGEVEAWQLGPVIRPCYVALAFWISAYLETGEVIEGFSVRDRLRGNVHEFRADSAPPADEFSASELEAMDTAWTDVMTRDWKGRQAFFHGSTFIGRAWQSATSCGRRFKNPMNWFEIVGNYERDANVDLSHIKTLMTL